MSFLKKNIWAISFFALIIILLAVMYATRDSTVSTRLSPDRVESFDFTINPNDHIKGPENAPVTLLEFSDFQCPACRSYEPVLEELLNMFPNELRLVYKHFPLSTIHIGALPSAQASEAAGLQGKFWEMHDLLFETQNIWSLSPTKDKFEKFAEDLGLDIEKFKNDYSSDEISNKINIDIELTRELGLNSTPTFYLNGKLIENPSSIREFIELINAELIN
ncbi:MAG: disulfide bond formation protein DsbA [Candidatus Zambryskibacteria bacterium CG_4_9_14_3_um_filter_40_16]|uniref:Disulfide bond formation protein DsbA n=2 Tax=Candidatus Zambryskiibacteriota TaxID=1817925 RepID=A0A2H0K6Y5_9BACT|nr:MAG: disulfide bond formation protein DsbA [Candidatus Zambryskibacteria bacterium CG11_big_fil_rev_8_21_14_0_20_40_24]PJA34598.1 MAG: disulfide bond formation protein DsbA [Candidatus Zambryskibacteria bacterium CG_4_9_14_3_um_filter_40_16]